MVSCAALDGWPRINSEPIWRWAVAPPPEPLGVLLGALREEGPHEPQREASNKWGANEL